MSNRFSKKHAQFFFSCLVILFFFSRAAASKVISQLCVCLRFPLRCTDKCLRCTGVVVAIASGALERANIILAYPDIRTPMTSPIHTGNDNAIEDGVWRRLYSPTRARFQFLGAAFS